MRIYHIAFFFILTFNFIHAQKSDFGAWYSVFNNIQFNKKINWNSEVQYRNFNFGGDLEQLLIRTGIGYNIIDNHNNVLAGYAFIFNEPYVGNTKTKNQEHRFYQQYLNTEQIGRFYLRHRHRIEQRIFEEAFKIRFRYLFGINIPINHNSMSSNTFYLSCYNELFVHVKSPVFDRDRLYGAFGYKINDRLKIEAGWITQFFESSRRSQIQLSVFHAYSWHNAI